MIMVFLLFALILLPFFLFLVHSRYKYFYTLFIYISASLPLIYASLHVLYTGIPLIFQFSISGYSSSLLKLDGLSSFFILTITFTVLTGMLYARGYFKADAHQASDTVISIHYFSLLWLYFSMVFICFVRDGLSFLIGWEIMTLSSFLLVIYRAGKKEYYRLE